MSGKLVVVGTSSWGIADDKTVEVIAGIKSAMENGTVVELELLDGKDPVQVFFNGRLVPTVMIGIDSDPKPSEING